VSKVRLACSASARLVTLSLCRMSACAIPIAARNVSTGSSSGRASERKCIGRMKRGCSAFATVRASLTLSVETPPTGKHNTSACPSSRTDWAESGWPRSPRWHMPLRSILTIVEGGYRRDERTTYLIFARPLEDTGIAVEAGHRVKVGVPRMFVCNQHCLWFSPLLNAPQRRGTRINDQSGLFAAQCETGMSGPGNLHSEAAKG